MPNVINLVDWPKQNLLLYLTTSQGTDKGKNLRALASQQADCLQQASNTHRQFVSVPFGLDAKKGRRDRQAENCNRFSESSRR